MLTNNRYVFHSFPKISAVVLALCFIGMSATVQAQKFYGGVSFGSSDVDAGIASGLITSGPVDGKDSGLKIFGGFQLDKNLGVEIGYVDLGETTYSGSFFGSPVTNGKIEISGINFSAVGALPVTPDLSVIGRIGLFAWDSDASDITGGVPFAASASDTDISFGFGVNYNFTKAFGARVEWERYDVAADADLFSAGLLFKF